MTHPPAPARRRPGSRRPARSGFTQRSGFTLIELMMVIAIIAILISILIPAVNAVLNRAHLAEVKTEMSAIEAGIASFESKFGTQPPSLITFDTTHKAWPATKAILRSMFPEISFSLGTTPNIKTDLTKAGLWGKTLHGPEALVFFLGGVRKRIDTDGNDTLDKLSKQLVGFSKNPARPFAQPTPGQAIRIGPFFEFDTARLIDDQDGDKAFAYMDALEGQSEPLLYLSTARTKSYVANDVAGFVSAASWEPYQKSADSPFNPTTFQIISPGYDGAYGNGGVINDETPADPKEADNITNFSSGTLGG